MYYYKVLFSDPSKINAEDFSSVYLLVSAAHNDLIRRGFRLLEDSDTELYHNGSTEAWIQKYVYEIPSLNKSELFVKSKLKCDSLIKQLDLVLMRSGISQSQFADIAHIDKGNLSKILSGVIYPNFKTWCRLTTALKMINDSFGSFIFPDLSED